MITILSPAKTFKPEHFTPREACTTPVFWNQAQELVEQMKSYSVEDLQSLMKVSAKIAVQNVERFHSFPSGLTLGREHQALYSFFGDVYRGLDAETLSDSEGVFAQDHLRILSGLYGLLRPLDLMAEYRLEMGTAFPKSTGFSLVKYWSNLVTKQLNEDLKSSGTEVLVNLASNEYASAIDWNHLHGRVVTPVFKELKNGAYKVIGIHAKRARGIMARFIIQHQIQDPEALKGFQEEGYVFLPDLSSEDEWVFAR